MAREHILYYFSPFQLIETYFGSQCMICLGEHTVCKWKIIFCSHWECFTNIKISSVVKTHRLFILYLMICLLISKWLKEDINIINYECEIVYFFLQLWIFFMYFQTLLWAVFKFMSMCSNSPFCHYEMFLFISGNTLSRCLFLAYINIVTLALCLLFAWSFFFHPFTCIKCPSLWWHYPSIISCCLLFPLEPLTY